MKSVFASKTNLFNVLVTVLGLVAYLQSVSTFEKYSVALGVVTVVGNLILRNFFTSQPTTEIAAAQLPPASGG